MAYHDLFKVSNFKILLRDQRHMEFFCQEAGIPGYNLGNIDVGYQSMKDKRPGDSIDFEDLTLTIICDEDLNAFKEVYNYLKLAHHPVTNALEVQQEMFDAYLLLTTNKNNVQHKLHFVDAWIQSVGAIQLQTISSEDNNITFPVTIRYNYYLFE
jgi:hypothetical protein